MAANKHVPESPPPPSSMPQSGGSIHVSTLFVGGEAVHGRYGRSVGVVTVLVTVSLPEISSRDTLNVGKYRDTTRHFLTGHTDCRQNRDTTDGHDIGHFSADKHAFLANITIIHKNCRDATILIEVGNEPRPVAVP
jgi:hypothetical protein